MIINILLYDFVLNFRYLYLLSFDVGEDFDDDDLALNSFLIDVFVYFSAVASVAMVLVKARISRILG